MTGEILNMGIGAAISAVIGSGISFLFWAGVQRKVEQRDKELGELRGAVRALKDEKVKGLEENLEAAKKDNHEKHGVLHSKIESTAATLHEKINRQTEHFVTRRECAAQHESTAREIGNLRHDMQALRGRVDEVAATVSESATITKLIADKMDVKI